MGLILRMGILGALLLGGGTGACAQQAVETSRQDRGVVSMTAYAPKATACRGVAIISPGAGGSAQGYRFLGEIMSSLGYLSVVVGHQESGRRALREHLRGNGLRDGLAELITDPEAYRGRFMDVVAARRWAGGRCASGESLLIGHSMGAATAMMEAGARNKLGIRGADAFSAYVALAPQGPGTIFPDDAWTAIRKPVLLLTGTRDDDIGGTGWQTRTEAFRSMPPGCKWLGVIDGASHWNFAGRGQSRDTEALTAQTIGAFLDAMQRGDCVARIRPHGMKLETK